MTSVEGFPISQHIHKILDGFRSGLALVRVRRKCLDLFICLLICLFIQ